MSTRTTIQTTVIDSLPAEARSGKKTLVHDVIAQAREAVGQYIRIEAASDSELIKLYKCLIQWRTRHPDQQLQLRKSGDILYIWFETEESAA